MGNSACEEDEHEGEGEARVRISLGIRMTTMRTTTSVMMKAMIRGRLPDKTETEWADSRLGTRTTEADTRLTAAAISEAMKAR